MEKDLKIALIEIFSRQKTWNKKLPETQLHFMLFWCMDKPSA